jgi:YD repeat-containing protein
LYGSRGNGWKKFRENTQLRGKIAEDGTARLTTQTGTGGILPWILTSGCRLRPVWTSPKSFIENDLHCTWSKWSEWKKQIMLAAKHFDPVVGVDIHIIQPPGPVPPVPIPHPFVGFLIDPADYVPIIGSTVMINGMHRAQAGTAGKCVPPHIPIGGVFVPPPPGNECEMFMGSATVVIDGEVQSYMSLPALSCQSVGMPSIPRISPKKKTIPKCLMLPTTVVLPIPAGPPLMIGGPPTISMSAMAMKIGLSALGKGFKKLRKLQKGSKKMKALSDKIQAAAKKAMDKLGIPPNVQNKVHRSICSVTGHPVDIATGKVFTDAVDIELPGPLPFRWERVYFSSSVYQGPLGHGWHHSYDLALAEEDEAVVVRLADGRSVTFPAIGSGDEHFDRRERLTLRRDRDGYFLVDKTGLSFRFGIVTFDRGTQSLLTVENRAGHRIAFGYDKYGNLEEIRDSAGRRLPVRTDSAGQILEIRGPHPDEPGQTISLVSYEYDSKGRLIAVRDALSQAMKFRYSGSLLTKETDRNGLSFYFEYDGSSEQARCVHTWGDGGIYNHHLEYDLILKRTKVTNSLGHSTLHFWNDDGLVFRAIDPLGGVKETVFNEYCQPLVELDELGQATTYAYDKRGNQTLMVLPDEAKLESVFNEFDLPVRATDALGNYWLFSWDSEGRMLSRIDGTSRETRYEYSERFLSAIVDSCGNVTQFSHDHFGNLELLTQPDGGQIRWRYDFLGRIVTETDTAGNSTKREYDLLGRVLRNVEADGNQRTLRYDAMGNVVYIKDRLHEVRFTFQGMGRLATRREAGTTVSFLYDTEEDLTAISNEHGHVYRFERDENRAIVREFGFDGIRRLYTRDAVGRVVRIERASGLMTFFQYDPNGRVTGVSHNDGTNEEYRWRKDGQLMAAINNSAVVTFERDAHGRILAEEQNGHRVTSEFDAGGRRSVMKSSLGAFQKIEHNAMGKVTGVQYRDESADPQKVVWETQIRRDQLGQELERTLPGGIHSRWERDRLGRPLRQQITGGGGDLRDVKYEWGMNDQLQKLVDNRRGTTTFEHDEAGNLAAASHNDGTTELRMPDAIGNLFRTRDRGDRKYGPAGQLLESISDQGVIRFEYDAEGNLIRKNYPGRSLGLPLECLWNTGSCDSPRR